MAGSLLFDRSAEIRFTGAMREIAGTFTYTNDQGPRISFALERSIRAEPDQGVLQIWNLPAEIARRIADDRALFAQQLKSVQTTRTDDKTQARRIQQVLQDHQIELWAGYAQRPLMLFRGDPISVRPVVRQGLDSYCEIRVGDGFVALQEQWMAATFGVGETPANLLAFASALADASNDDGKMRAAIAQVAPNAQSARLTNGWVAQGRPADVIADVAEMLKLTWWVRNGAIEFVERGKWLQDVAVHLDAATSLTRLEMQDDGRYLRFTCVLDPLVHPGRAVLFTDADGAEYRGRVLQTSIQGDTHGDAWEISGIADVTPWQGLPEVLPSGVPVTAQDIADIRAAERERRRARLK